MDILNNNKSVISIIEAIISFFPLLEDQGSIDYINYPIYEKKVCLNILIKPIDI